MSDATSSRYMSGGIYESESQRLQKEADNFTKKYEHMRKLFMLLEDQWKQAERERDQRQEAISTERLSQGLILKNKHKIKVLENQLEKEVTKYNSYMSGNKGKKREIDVSRKEVKTARIVLKGLDRDIAKLTKKIRKENEGNTAMQKSTEDTHNQILALKAKHEGDKIDFEKKLKVLQIKLDETDTSSKRMKRSMMAEDSGSKMTPSGGNSNEEFSNPALLLQERLNKWTQNNIEKKKLMDRYIRNVKVIEDAFMQIKEQTGIASTDEIVTTFIKADEQNHSLQNYVNTLITDIDLIEDQNKNILNEIKKHEALMNMSEKEKQDSIKNIQDDLDVSKFNLEKQDHEIDTKENNLLDI